MRTACWRAAASVIETFLSRLDRRGRRRRRQAGRHRRRRQLGRPRRHAEIGAERSGRPAGLAPGAGRPCAPPAAGVAQCARDRELRGAGPRRHERQAADQGRARQDRQRRASRRIDCRSGGRCLRARLVEPGLAREFRLRAGRRKSGSRSASATPRASIAAVRPILAASSPWSSPAAARTGAMASVLYQTEDRWIVSIGGYLRRPCARRRADVRGLCRLAADIRTSTTSSPMPSRSTDFVTLSLSRQFAAALRAAGALSERLSGVRRRRVQLQSGLRPGHDGGGAGGGAAARMPRGRAHADLARRFFTAAQPSDRHRPGISPSATICGIRRSRVRVRQGHASSTGISASCTWPRATTQSWRPLSARSPISRRRRRGCCTRRS